MRRSALLWALCLWPLVLGGCATTAPNVRPTPPAVAFWPNPAAPTPVYVPTPLLWLQVGAANTYGLFTEYEVFTPNGSGSQSAFWPSLNPPRLTLALGQSLTLKHDQPTAPDWLLIEQNAQDVFLRATVITAPNDQYTPTAAGVFLLTVRGQWQYRYYTTYIFNLEVIP